MAFDALLGYFIHVSGRIFTPLGKHKRPQQFIDLTLSKSGQTGL